MRLRTLPLAAASILTGSAAAWHLSANPWTVLILALSTTFLLQILSNLANDYGDFARGIDNDERTGPKRTMQSGLISKSEMKRALILCATLAFFSGVALLGVTFGRANMLTSALFFLAIGLLAIAAAFRYTMGKNPYGYMGLGDLAVFVFFGIVGVGGAFYLHAFKWNSEVLVPAFAIGFFSVAVLNLNNLRDHMNDKAGGKITVVVRLGFEMGKIYQLMLVSAGVFCCILWSGRNDFHAISLLPLLPAAMQLLLLPKIFRTKIPKELDGELKKVAMLTFLYSLMILIIAIAP